MAINEFSKVLTAAFPRLRRRTWPGLGRGAAAAPGTREGRWLSPDVSSVPRAGGSGSRDQVP